MTFGFIQSVTPSVLLVYYRCQGGAAVRSMATAKQKFRCHPEPQSPTLSQPRLFSYLLHFLRKKVASGRGRIFRMYSEDIFFLRKLYNKDKIT